MAIQVAKTENQIQAMRKGGQILAKILTDLKSYVKPGMTGIQIDDWIGEQIALYGASATYKESEVNFPANICISSNHQIVHAIPTNLEFKKGDVVSFDLTISYQAMKVDSAITIVVGEKPTGAKKLLLTQTEKSLYAGISQVKPGADVAEISKAIEKVLKKSKLGIVRELVGHGVGQDMHMPPEIPNYSIGLTGFVMQPGDTLAIEPMATLGKEAIKTEPDGWSISTRDGSLAAHFEHTVLVTSTGYEILTQLTL